MNDGNRWATGVIIAGIVILAIGGLAYAINKHHQENTFVGEPSSNSGNGVTGGSNSASSTDTTNPSSPPTSSPPSCIPASQAASQEGQTGCVQFTGYAYTSSSGQMYLDQSTSAPYGFSAYIPAGSSFGPSLLSQYSGQSVDVTGSIINYRGEPEIEVTSVSQVQLAQ